MLKDSYANSFVPFLAQHYRKIVMVDPRYYYGDLEQLIQVENVQEILYLFNANTFFADTSLELALTSESSDQNTEDTGSSDGQNSDTADTAEEIQNQDTSASDSEKQTSDQETDSSEDQV